MDEKEILNNFNKRHGGDVISTDEILALIRYTMHCTYNTGYLDCLKETNNGKD